MEMWERDIKSALKRLKEPENVLSKDQVKACVLLDILYAAQEELMEMVTTGKLK